RLLPGLHHLQNFVGLLKVIQFVGLDPPASGLHEQLGIIILVGKEGIEGDANILALMGDFLLADMDNFLSQAGTHLDCSLNLKSHF
ncbi:hypothetical protein JV206_11435, partial [Shewanella indica]